jgi:adenine/guanine phosphoribosyltransferase-like PRPP-binding protein
MDEAEVWSALERGGAARQVSFDERDGQVALGMTKYNGLLDPGAAERLVGALAERLKDRGATLVVVWEDIEDLVLGFVAGRQLDVPVLWTFNADGLVGHAGPLSRGARAILVTDCVRDQVASRAVRALLASSGSLLLGVAALVDSGIAEEPLLATLVALEVPGGRTGAS